MLPARHRLRTRAQFAAAVKGRRAGGPVVVVHAALTDASEVTPARVGFVVSKAVGNAVRRNRTKRVLRALIAERLRDLPAGRDVVVRATPATATADRALLAGELDRLLAKALSARPGRVGSRAASPGIAPRRDVP